MGKAAEVKDLYDKRTAPYANIDAQLFSALVNATGGGAWGDELCQNAMDEVKDACGRQFMRKLDEKFLMQHSETATLATQALHNMTCRKIDNLESYIMDYKKHIKTPRSVFTNTFPIQRP